MRNKSGPKPQFKQLQDKNWLITQYRIKKKPMSVIAAMIGCGETTVHKWIKRHGIPRFTRSEQLKGKPKSSDHYAKMKKMYKKWKKEGTFAKENHPNWRGGTTKKNQKARGVVRNFRTEVYRRAGIQCEVCQTKTRLHAHHIFDFNNYPDLRYDADNGICLCETCHFYYHKITRLIRRKPIYKKMGNPEPAEEIAKGSSGVCDGQD